MGAQKVRDGSPGQAVGQGTARPDDMLVMATNKSSISSKRSVERLYYPNEPHFFRFFVNKFQRRAPLINRGYYLRLHVIDVTLRNFLLQPSPILPSQTKVVVNLGCGSDVIPWQCWTRYPDDSRSHTQFVDVDFPDLIKSKRQVVLNTPELMAHLSGVEISDTTPNVLLRSDRYTQIGVDLRNITALENALASVVDVQDCHFLFVAEVSITYMETSAADALIQWAAGLGQAAEFCLLEQILPDGPGHPFAETMLHHFDKLSCPIKSVATYSTIAQQCERFRSKGWSRIEAQSLWSAWSGDSFLTPENRRELDQVEPFDEHEEFALFASHYLLLHARSYGDNTAPSEYPVSQIPTKEVDTTYSRLTAQHGLRRFGAAMAVKDAFGNGSIINCLGLGNNNRLSSYDVYTRGGVSHVHIKPRGGPTSRMCASLTDFGHGVLLAGGRSSPAKPMSDCWVFRKDIMMWERTHDLPVPLYRHSACRLGDSSLILVLGGRPGVTGISDLITVYHPEDGWLRCKIGGPTRPKLVFGATLICSGRMPGRRVAFDGFCAGGLSADGVIDRQALAWTLLFEDNHAPTITFRRAVVSENDTAVLLPRFGAACVEDHGSFIVLGGVGCEGYISRENDIIIVSTSGSKIEASTRLLTPVETPRPLIIGSSVLLLDDRDLVIVGGAATCFSMGTFWTRGVYTLKLPDERLDNSALGWEFSHSGEIVQMPSDDLNAVQKGSCRAESRPVPRARLNSGDSFEKIIALDQPVILEGLDIGPCTSKWSLDYLTRQIGEDRKVVVHDSYSQSMDFNAKNFRYATVTFGDFATQVKHGRRLYLRALSADAPADKPANLEQDFPVLAPDFVLPDQLRVCRDNMHSSVLRISGPVHMWLHYDVQANVYCQISGSKRMVLYPPSDISRLSFAPGASSSSIDVFDSTISSALARTHPFEADLCEGDVLFLPPLWLHTSAPTSDVSVAVNVFFRSLGSTQYGAGRDVYGNKDLAAYDKGRQDVARIVNSFGKTSANCKQFYLLRLADELAEEAEKHED